MDKYYDNLLKLDEVIQQIKFAIDNKKPYSLVRFGHGEMHVVGHKIFPKHRNSIYFGYYNKYAGITDLSDDITAKLLNALKKADLVGLGNHVNYNKELLEMIIKYYNLYVPPVCSAWICDEMIETQEFFELLKPLKVVIVGRRAKEGAEKFRNLGINVVATMGHEGFDEMDNTINKVCNINDFDIVLVAAGVPATIMCPEIAEKTGKVAIDFGHALDVLIEGKKFDHEKKVANFYTKLNTQKAKELKKRNSEITVFMASFNPGKFLRTSLESIFSQTYPNWQLILIDDCSTDNSLYTVKDLLKDSRIIVIKNPDNLGQSEAQNKALELITTPYCIQLNSDDWLLPDALEKLLNSFNGQPEDIAVVSGNFINVNNEAEFNGLDKDNLASHVCKGRIFKDKYDFLFSNVTLLPRCYRTSALKNIGGWPTKDPYNGRYLEDRTVLSHLIEQNHFYWIDDVLYVNRLHALNQTNNLASYNYILEWHTMETLKRWGNKYRPIFQTDNNGKKYIYSVIPKY